MFIICDQKDIVRDISSEKANLSRGYNFVGHKLYKDVKENDIRVGDSYKAGVLIKNEHIRQINLERQEAENKIAEKVRQDAIEALIAAGELPAGYK